ncbi:sigma factor-like helix-turn-helix DNA-binding protein [Streptomyces ginkgonis]|uniref:sigma factor-like helix-turn-helix DNA-binding protein n=1 Tax=Streptomyces ginkgonis TaxID=1812259 RepID=UPI002176E4E1|nr:sigma factor-like helix-turn-helix DNA-binding protein [Streptomyces ginkgonis]
MTKPPKVQLPADFEVFFTAEHRRLLAYAMHQLRDRRDAEEAVLEAGTLIFRKWHTVLGHANPMALVYKIMRDVTRDFYRRSARVPEVAVAEPPDSAYLHELRSHEPLDTAMDTLRRAAPLQAECVTMRYLMQMEYADISDRLDITAGAARTNVSLGLARLRELMTTVPRQRLGGQ